MYVLAVPHHANVSDAEKLHLVQTVLIIASGNPERAFQYLEYCRTALDPDHVQIGVSAFEYMVSG